MNFRSSELEITLKYIGRIAWVTEHKSLRDTTDLQLKLDIDTCNKRAVIFLSGKLYFKKKRQPVSLYIFLPPEDIMSICFTRHPDICTYDVSLSFGSLCFTMARPPSLVGPSDWPLEPKERSRDLLGNMKALSTVCEFTIELDLSSIEAEVHDQLASLHSVLSVNSLKCFKPNLESFLPPLYAGDGGQRIHVGTNTTPNTSSGYQGAMVNPASSRLPSPTHNGMFSRALLLWCRKRRRPNHTFPLDITTLSACQGPSENPTSPGKVVTRYHHLIVPNKYAFALEQHLQRINDVWAPSDKLSILNDRIATLETWIIRIQTHLDDLVNQYSPCRYDTEEAETIKVQGEDFTERQVQDMRIEVVGEFNDKLEGSVQDEIAAFTCDVQEAVQNKLDEIDEIQECTQGLRDQFGKIAAEVKEITTKVAEIEHNTNNRLDRLEQKLESSTRGNALPIDFEFAVSHILVTYADELTADEKMRVLEFLQANPSSATIYNLCGANSATSLQRNFINKWK
ncbi:hypothetical protein QBC40DRAFT_319478, partial [Triangularia verruculosa]